MSQAATSILVAVITGGLSLVGVILTIRQTSKKTETAFQIAQAVMNEKIEQLRKSVDKHNNFAERLPRLEQRVEDLEKQLNK